MLSVRVFVKRGMILLLAMLGIAGCAHEARFERNRSECQKIERESERALCLQNVNGEQREYERQRNETRIEREYKRKLEDMKRR
jgi:hypothetical protein